MSDDRNSVSDCQARRLRLWVLLFVLFTIVTGVTGAWTGIYRKYNPLSLWEQSTIRGVDPMSKTRHVIINGTDLWIPIAYFQPLHLPVEGVHKAALITVTYPDFAPLTERPQRMAEQGRWFEHHVTFLIQDRSVMKDALGVYQSYRRLLNATQRVGTPYGLEHYQAPRESQVKRGDLYIDRVGDDIVGLMRCNGDRDVPNPQCSYKVWHSAFLFEMNFDKELLPHWRDLRDSMIELTNRFEGHGTTFTSINDNAGD